MSTRYLYGKIMSSYNNEDTVKLILTPEEKAFIKGLNINYNKSENNDYVTVNRAEFLEKIAA